MNGDERTRQRERMRRMLRHARDAPAEREPLEDLARALDRLPADLANEGSSTLAVPWPRALTEQLAAAAAEIAAHEPDLAFTTAAEGLGAPHLEIWRLGAEGTAGEATKRTGCTCSALPRRNQGEPYEHPWPTAAVLIEGTLVEHGASGETREHQRGTVLLRPRGSRYRVTVPGPDPAVLLTATGAWGDGRTRGNRQAEAPGSPPPAEPPKPAEGSGPETARARTHYR